MSIDGERRVAGKLRRLPRGWKVYNDVDLGGARIDHVVVGPSSVWVIEAHHATGSFAVDDDGFYRNGIRNTWTIPKLGKARASLAENVGARPIPVLALCRGYDGLARLGVARVAGISDLVPMMVDEDASGAGSGVTDQGREWLSAQEVPAWRRMLGLGMA